MILKFYRYIIMRYTIKKNKTTSLSKRKILKNKSFVPTFKKSYHKKWKDSKIISSRVSKKKKRNKKKKHKHSHKRSIRKRNLKGGSMKSIMSFLPIPDIGMFGMGSNNNDDSNSEKSVKVG